MAPGLGKEDMFPVSTVRVGYRSLKKLLFAHYPVNSTLVLSALIREY